MNPKTRTWSDQLVLQTPRFSVLERTVVTADERPLVKHLVQHQGSVAILPCLDADRICLIQNFRYALGDYLWEIPAGTLEPGETPAACAVRELQEETGYLAAQWTAWGDFYVSPGIMTEKMHLFLAEGLTSGPQHLDTGEEICVEVFTRQAAFDLMKQRKIQDAKTLIALSYLLLQGN